LYDRLHRSRVEKRSASAVPPGDIPH
jgi:hypothetical protein